uniref:Ammonium transporter n=1 Tax=Alexandrium tamarense TaxID=2926 RepID=A0A0K2STQ7_ALETA|nr:ammonium transporter [Alexandrium tamarense]
MTTLTALESEVNELRTKLGQLESDHNESLDTIWMMLCAMLVFFMHAGFSLLEAGSVRFKNTQNILAKNLIVVTGGFLCWYVLGYALALGVVDEPNKFSGGTNFLMDGLWDDKTTFRTWFFQGAFCATGATIVSGAMAERTKLLGFSIYVVLMTSIIYPIVAYWGWSGSGFLYYEETKSIVGPAYMDFAGSGIVHMVGGVAALCGAIIVGARKSRFDPESADEFDGHSVPFCVLGTFFLWFGWYGFNPGSTLEMHDTAAATKAGLVAANTTLAPCVSGLLVFLLRAKVVQPKRLDVGGFCNGILAGLVAITAGCAFVKSWEAILIGLFGGLIYQGASMLLKLLKIDDVVDAFPVHGACGAWGVLALGFFGNPDEGMGGNGVFYGGDQLGVQIVALLIIALWSATLSVAAFLPLRMLGALRLSDEFQTQGADVMEHSPSKAYADSGASKNEKTVV